MAQVYYKDRDGLTRGFEIAGDQPTASEQARISALLNGETPQTNTPAPESQTGILGMVGQGVGAGWNQMQAGAMGLAGLAAKNDPEGKFLGYTPEQYEKFRQEQNNEAATYETPEGGFGDQEGAYDTTRYLAYQLGQSIPATAGGLAGSVVGTAMAPGIGTVGGFMVGAGLAGLSSLPQSYNENIETQIATHGKIKDSG